MAPGKQRKMRAVSGVAVSSDDEEAAVIMLLKIKESIDLTDPNATRKEQHKLQPKRLQPFNTTAAAEARPRSKHAPLASPSQASTSRTASERQRVMEEANKWEES
jgi:hypothetical protein